MAEVCGMYFSKIHVRYQRIPDGNPPDSSNYFNVWTRGDGGGGEGGGDEGRASVDSGGEVWYEVPLV